MKSTALLLFLAIGAACGAALAFILALAGISALMGR